MLRKYWNNRIIAMILGVALMLSFMPLTVDARAAIDLESDV